MRPLLTSLYPEDSGKLRLIGLELRIVSPEGMREELKMVELEVELLGCSNAAYAWEFGPSAMGLPRAQPQVDSRNGWFGR
jgi:hypothetical protein